MENSYGVGVTNRYALFLEEDEDPLEVLKVQEQEKEAKKKTKLSEKENKSKSETKGKSAQVGRKVIKETQNVKTLETGKNKEENNKKVNQRAGNVKFAAESREERNNRRNREERPVPTSDFNRDAREPREGRDAPRSDTGEGRGRGRGAGRGLGRGRGSRGGRGGYDIRGKREFDRQSGSDKTGVKPVDKREGGGAHNWGNHRDDIEEQLNTSGLSEDNHEWALDKPDTDGQIPVDCAEVKEGEAGETEESAQVEEEPKELTLDEYKALRGNRQKPTYNLRKAGEGEDLTQWKKMYALKKKEGEEEEDEEEEYDASEYPQRVGRQKHLLDIDIHFADSRRGTRGRGRGGPRGGRGGMRGIGGTRGGVTGSRVGAGGSSGGGGGGGGDGRGPPPRERSDRDRAERFDKDRGERPESFQSRGPRQSAPKVDDEHDFPSLG